MTEIFRKTNFPSSKERELYHWKEADTTFQIVKDGFYIISITAYAKNAEQNKKDDDDDLRVVIDGYEFGLHELHDEKVSWKGFGTASAWNGASLKGGKKTIYYFVELRKGEHKIEFYADETPSIHELRVEKYSRKFEVEWTDFSSCPQSDRRGIPFVAFVFLGVKPSDFAIAPLVKSAAQKGGTDGDNVKVVENGKIITNVKSPQSDKYKNFYFSGDLNKGKSKVLGMEPEVFELTECSVELWYDENPSVFVKIELYKSIGEYWRMLMKRKFKKFIIREQLKTVVAAAKKYKPKLIYTRDFLAHSLQDKPAKLKFDENDLIASKIREDKAFVQVLEFIGNSIRAGKLKHTIVLDLSSEPGDEIVFESGDLFASIHGVREIRYRATKIDDKSYDVRFVLFDTYDFSHVGYLSQYYKKVYKTDSGIGDLGKTLLLTYVNNLADDGEEYGVVQNFDIEVQMREEITIKE